MSEEATAVEQPAQATDQPEKKKRRRRTRIGVKKKQYGIRLGTKNHRAWFADKDAGAAWKLQKRREYERDMVGIGNPAKPILFKDAVEQFKVLRENGVQIKIENGRWRDYVLPKFGDRHLHSIRFEEWRVFLGDRDNSELGIEPGELRTVHKLAASTTNAIRNQLNLLYKWAIRNPDVLCDKNPIEHISEHAIPKKSVQHLTNGTEVGHYLHAAGTFPECPEWGAMAWLLVSTGQRIGQIMGVRWGDIDFERSRITFKWKWRDSINDFVEGGKKRDGEHHWLFLPPPLKQALMEWKLRTRFSRDTDLVVANQFLGTKMPRTKIFHMNIKTLKRAGLSQQKVHAIRHTYATLYLEAGGKLHDLKEVMNHSSITVTEKYLQVNQEKLQRMSSVLTFSPIQPEAPVTIQLSTGTDST